MSISKKYFKERGIAIIELLVAISVITVLAGTIVISDFSKAKKEQALSRTAYKFAQDLRKTQNRAQSLVKAGSPEVDILAYGVHINKDSLGNKKYIVYGKPLSLSFTDPHYESVRDYLIETVDLSLTEPGVVINFPIAGLVDGNKVSILWPAVPFSASIPTEPNTFIFSVYPPDPRLNPKVDIVFSLESDSTKTKTVSVNWSGLIEVK